MDRQNILDIDKTLEAEILELLPDSGRGDFSQLARDLFRLGVAAERECQAEPAAPQERACI